MSHQEKEDHARAVQRTLDTVFGHVPGAREAFPELGAVRDLLSTQGLKALDRLPPLDRQDVLARLKALKPDFGPRQLEALVNVLTRIDRRGLRRSGSENALVSTPEMFAAEVPMEAFIGALGKGR